jgi:hypothetical protein
MAMLPEGFTPAVCGYEQSAKAPDVNVGRGPPPVRNAAGFKQMAIGTYTDGWSSASHTGTAEPKGEKETMLAVTQPAAYSRDWSGK